MFTYSKDDIAVASTLDSRKAYSVGKCLVCIRISYKPECYAIGKELTKEDGRSFLVMSCVLGKF